MLEINELKIKPKMGRVVIQVCFEIAQVKMETLKTAFRNGHAGTNPDKDRSRATANYFAFILDNLFKKSRIDVEFKTHAVEMDAAIDDGPDTIGIIAAFQHIKEGVRVQWMGANGILYPLTITRESNTPGDFYAKNDDGKESYYYIEQVKEIEIDGKFVRIEERRRYS